MLKGVKPGVVCLIGFSMVAITIFIGYLHFIADDTVKMNVLQASVIIFAVILPLGWIASILIDDVRLTRETHRKTSACAAGRPPLETQ